MIFQTLHTPPITLEELCRLDTFPIAVGLARSDKPNLFILLKDKQFINIKLNVY